MLACPNRDSIIAKKTMHAISHGRIFEDLFCTFVYLFQTKIVCLQWWASKFHELILAERRDTDRTVSLHFNARRTHLKCLFICVKRAVYPVKEKWQNAKKLISLLMPKKNRTDTMQV